MRHGPDTNMYPLTSQAEILTGMFPYTTVLVITEFWYVLNVVLNHNGKCVIMTFMQDVVGVCTCATYDTLVYHLNA